MLPRTAEQLQKENKTQKSISDKITPISHLSKIEQKCSLFATPPDE